MCAHNWRSELFHGRGRGADELEKWAEGIRTEAFLCEDLHIPFHLWGHRIRLYTRPHLLSSRLCVLSIHSIPHITPKFPLPPSANGRQTQSGEKKICIHPIDPRYTLHVQREGEASRLGARDAVGVVVASYSVVRSESVLWGWYWTKSIRSYPLPFEASSDRSGVPFLRRSLNSLCPVRSHWWVSTSKFETLTTCSLCLCLSLSLSSTYTFRASRRPK